MLFTTKTEYGLKALTILAQNKSNKPVSLADISRQADISLSYLEQIFAKLKRAKLIKSIKGAEGGYALAQPAKAITLLKIIEALEGDLAIFYCMADGGCSARGCLTKKVWADVQSSVVKILNKYKLSNLI
ncbi:MAG: RrF2 family transcriptional regulator [Candidatus Buchananbacteria bacterium]